MILKQAIFVHIKVNLKQVFYPKTGKYPLISRQLLLASWLKTRIFLLDLKLCNILKQGKPSLFQDNYDLKTRSNLLVSGLCNSFLLPENKEKISDFKESGSFLGSWVPCFKHWNVLSQDLEIRLF